jgi:hypothetical protein
VKYLIEQGGGGAQHPELKSSRSVPNAAAQGRAANNVPYETHAQSARPLKPPSRTLNDEVLGPQGDLPKTAPEERHVYSKRACFGFVQAP